MSSLTSTRLFMITIPKHSAKSLQKLSTDLGISPQTLALLGEISPTEITETNHMVCVMKSYLCGLILEQYGVPVYWLDVVKTVTDAEEVHVSILARLPNGLYRIVDARFPKGSGEVPEQYLTAGEVEKLLTKSPTVTKTLDINSKSLHHVIKIFWSFEAGARGSVYKNLGIIFNSLNRYAEAEKAFRKALDTDSQDFLSWSRSVPRFTAE